MPRLDPQDLSCASEDVLVCDEDRSSFVSAYANEFKDPRGGDHRGHVGESTSEVIPARRQEEV